MNLENPAFRSIGVGVAIGGPFGIYWVQDFAGGVSAGASTAAAAPSSSSRATSAGGPSGAAPRHLPLRPPRRRSRRRPPARLPAPARRQPAGATPASTGAPAITEIGSAITAPEAAQGVHADRRHKLRRTRLAVTKPHAGQDYVVHMSFGSVRVATENLAVTCRAKLAGQHMRGKGEIADHVATCTWAIPAGADGKRLEVTVKVSGRHGISLVRHAKLIVGN